MIEQNQFAAHDRSFILSSIFCSLEMGYYSGLFQIEFSETLVLLCSRGASQYPGQNAEYEKGCPQPYRQCRMCSLCERLCCDSALRLIE